MAYIYKLKKKDKRVSTIKKSAYQNIYQNAKWKRLRAAKFKNNPICENCLEKEITEPTAEIHHIIKFSEGLDDNEVKILAFSYENTKALCTKCHKEAHENYQTDLLLRMKLLHY